MVYNSVMNITQEDFDLYAPKLSLTRHTGALLWWFQQTYTYRGSPEKLKSELISISVKNLIFGWWSPMSLIINPAVTIGNLIYFQQYKKRFADFISSPEPFIVKAKGAEKMAAEKADKGLKKALIILGVVVGIFAIVIIYAVTR